MTIDRRARGYEPRFDLDYEVGSQGELWTENIVDALAHDRVEVKTDQEALRTGNLYVEFECLGRGGWRRSGIAITQAEIWVFVLQPQGLALVITTDLLRRAAREHYPDRVRECTRGSHPTKGVVIPISLLITEARRAA